MDFRDLRYFEAVAELEHIGKAAEALHKTQPAITGCVHRLEESCGAPLLEKSGRGVRLTPEGQVLLRWAQRIRNDVEGAKREIAEVHMGISGHVRVGLIPTAAHSLLPAAVRELLRHSPKATLKVVIGLVDTLIPMLKSGDLDLVIGTEGPPDSSILSKVLTDDSIVVAAREGHSVFQGSFTLRNLSAYRWVLQPPGAPTRDWLDQQFDRLHLPRPQVQVESSMLLMMPSLIAETDLLSFIPRQHLSYSPHGSRLRELPLDQVTMHRRIVMSYRESAHTPATLEQLIDLFRRVAKGLSQA